MRDEKPMVVVLSFAAYEAAKPKCEPDFMRFAGMLSHEDAEAMSSFVNNADFSKITSRMSRRLNLSVCSSGR